MYGTSETMVLKVFVMKDEEPVLVWERTGNHGDQWILGEVTVHGTGNVQVRTQAPIAIQDEPCFAMAHSTCEWS